MTNKGMPTCMYVLKMDEDPNTGTKITMTYLDGAAATMKPMKIMADNIDMTLFQCV